MIAVSDIEKDIEKTILKIYDQVRDDKIEKLEQAYSNQIRQHEDLIAILRTKVENYHKLIRQNNSLEIDKKILERQMKDLKECCDAEKEYNKKLYHFKLEKFKKKYRAKNERTEKIEKCLNRIDQQMASRLKVEKVSYKSTGGITGRIKKFFGCFGTQGTEETAEFPVSKVFDDEGNLIGLWHDDRLWVEVLNVLCKPGANKKCS